MIPNMEKCKSEVKSKRRWRLLAVVQLLALLRGITQTNGDFYCLNCLHFLNTKNKLQLHKKRKNKDFCNVVMPSEDTKMLEFNQHQKSDKASFINYVDLECMIDKIV